jgi:hypothetical protein
MLTYVADIRNRGNALVIVGSTRRVLFAQLDRAGFDRRLAIKGVVRLVSGGLADHA